MDDNPYNPYPHGPHGDRQDQPGPPVHPADAQMRLPMDHAQTYQPLSSPTIPFSSGSGVPAGPGMPVEDVLPILRTAAQGDFLLNLIFIGFLWEVWVCLYPVAALAGILTLIYGMPFLRSVLPPSPVIGPGLFAVVLAFVAAAVVLWSVSRLEHVLAGSGPYRILRHAVRLPLLGLATVIMIQKVQGLPYDPMPAGVMQVLKTPTNPAIVLGVMIASHFILWNWKWGREFWHRRLMSAQLRERDT